MTKAILFSLPLALFTPLLADSIIPKPITQINTEKRLSLNAQTKIIAPSTLKNEATLLSKALQPAMGASLKIQEQAKKGVNINLVLDQKLLKNLGKEGYTLNIDDKGIFIKAATNTGIFYGTQSLIHLLPENIVQQKPTTTDWSVPHTSISDKPRFPWRAFMLDEARHFKGEKEVKKLLDQMAALKMNVFHWHLTDDQGWRIEIKKYPLLIEIGSKRTNTQTKGWGSPTRSGKPHSGFYTQEQIKDIVAYAKARHITIVPEIGMPGHAVAAIASYPKLGTNKKKIPVMVVFGKAEDVYDPSEPFVYEFVSNVIDEVIALFPSQVIHIGGDEVKFGHWKNSKNVQALMQKEGLKTMADVQIYFTNRIAQIVQKKGRNIMGWNEILGDDLHGFLKGGQTASAAKPDKDTVVHFWKGSTDIAKRAIKQGHTIVNSIHSSTYLDYGYGSISLGKAYAFNPIIGGLTPEEEKKIIGLGCQMWSEWIPTVKRMEFQVYPRLAAYAEVGWTATENKNFADFKKRMKRQTKRWDIQGIQYAKNQISKVSKQDFFNYQKIDEWSPRITPENWKNVTFSTLDQIKGAKTYKVAFVYEKGDHALDIKQVELLENGQIVASAEQIGFSGGSMKNIVYTLPLKKFNPGATYALRAKIKGSGGTNSAGEIKIISE